MTDLIVRPQLLPRDYANANRAAASLVDVDGRLDDVDTASILTIKDVDTAPSAFLPYLAWEVGVDVWRGSWSDDRKRAVIKASPTIKKHKGTKYAVKTAVAALGVIAYFEEWFEITPRAQPYTFTITTFVNYVADNGPGQPLITPELTADLFASVNAAKPVSRAFTFRIGAIFQSNLGLASAGRALQMSEQLAGAGPKTDLAAGIGLAAAGRSLEIAASMTDARPLTDLACAAGIAAAGRTIQIISATMEAAP